MREAKPSPTPLSRNINKLEPSKTAKPIKKAMLRDIKPLTKIEEKIYNALEGHGGNGVNLNKPIKGKLMTNPLAAMTMTTPRTPKKPKTPDNKTLTKASTAVSSQKNLHKTPKHETTTTLIKINKKTTTTTPIKTQPMTHRVITKSKPIIKAKVTKTLSMDKKFKNR
jgi:hypothetical protein